MKEITMSMGRRLRALLGGLVLLASTATCVSAAASASSAESETAAGAGAELPPAFLKQLPPADAIAVKSWAFLGKSMEALGEETAELVRVKADLQDMAGDVRAQQVFWDHAKFKLSQENTIL